MSEQPFKNDVCVVGGCGHVGLPFGISAATAGMNVVLYDISEEAVGRVLDKQMPFKEEGAQELLERAVNNGKLEATTDASVIADSEVIIMVIGTPVDPYLNPMVHEVMRAIEDIKEYMRKGQLLIMRSTLFPGTTDWIARILAAEGINIDIAFCPERILEHHAIRELAGLPQLTSGTSQEALDRATNFFSRLAAETVAMTTEEAELAKLMTNVWRYLEFAIANQMYMIAESKGINFVRLLKKMRHKYPRLAHIFGAGFAAGPCLFKDNQQLKAYAQGVFALADAAMRVNEGLPDFVVDQLERKYESTDTPLHTKTVGILGMAFKGGSDDPRASLSYKLRKILRMKSGRVLCTDPYIDDPRFVSLEEVLSEADIIIVAAPHPEYRGLAIDPSIDVVDMWDITEGANA